ncbi:hypothetical protein GBK02_08790 [Dechloromonas sp. TW-R-39-2]|nr:hypothetical protein GBK02_08790 [Dechloromonas sp. TW-R-39-2]
MLFSYKRVFFSHNYPINHFQQMLVESVELWLASKGIECLTVKSTHQSVSSAITEIRSRIQISDAVLAMALPKSSETCGESPVTTPWVHMEAAMALQAVKPLALIKDRRLPLNGVFDQVATKIPVLEIDTNISQAEFLVFLEKLSFYTA